MEEQDTFRYFLQMASGHSIAITTEDRKANYTKISPVARQKLEKQVSQ